MSAQWRVFLAAVQYFTRLPVPASVGHSQQLLDDAARYFPAVGTLVGVASAAAFFVGSLLLPPTVAASALASVEFIERHPERVTRLHENARYFRAAIREAGFSPLEGDTPIVPIIIGETADAIRMSERLLAEGIFVTGFGFPVVPHGTARLRCQISADRKSVV